MDFIKKNNYALVLFGFVGLLIIPALSEDPRAFARQWNIFISISIIVSYFSIFDTTKDKLKKIFYLFLCIIPVILNGAMFSIYSNKSIGVIFMTLFFNILVLINIIERSARHIYKAKRFDTNIILASITIYLLIGLVGSLLFSMIETYDPKAIIYPDHLITLNNRNILYFSFTTLTTLGYGDILPANGLAQGITILISITGQLYLAILMAIIIGKFLNDMKTKKSDDST